MVGMLHNPSHKRFFEREGAVLLLFLLYFLLLFSQFPLNGSLTGNTDTWWYLSVFNDYRNAVGAWFTGEEVGTALYPEQDVASFGEPSYGSALFFLLFKLFGFNDLWAWYLLMSLIFATNAWGVFLISKYLNGSNFGGIFSGFLFASSAFAFGHLDDQKVVAFFFCLLSVYFFLRFLDSGESRFFLFTVLAGGIEIYFSGYNFIFQSLILGVLGILNIGKILRTPSMRKGLAFFPVYILLIFPFAWKYLIDSQVEKSVNPIDLFSMAEAVSLNLKDFFQSLQNNLIYPDQFDKAPRWVFPWHSANLGLVAWIVAVVGLWKTKRYRTEWLVLFFLGLIIALGAFIQIGGRQFRMPMYYAYTWLPLSGILRIPIRAFFISLLAFSILGGAGMKYILSRVSVKSGVFGLLILLFLVENVPVPFISNQSGKYLKPPREYTEFLREKEGAVVLNLPSTLLDKQYNPELSASGREQVYMFWQTFHKQNVINGSGYLPVSRVENQKLIDRIREPGALDSLILGNGLTYIVYHQNMLLPDEDPDMMQVLEKADSLISPERVTDKIAIFEVIRPMSSPPLSDSIPKAF
jgi:hypothetical protein